MKNGKRARTSRPRQHWLAIGMALLVGGHLGLVKAEESSIMTGATVPTALRVKTPSGDVIINGSYKSSIAGVNSNDNEITIALSQKEILQTVVVVAGSNNSNSADKLGGSEIVLVNSAGELVSKSGVYDTGIYTLSTTAEATSIVIRRVAGGGGGRFSFSHVRGYQSTNIMQFAIVHYATAPVDSDHTAQNLINNPESRSSSNLWNARTEAAWLGARAGYYSCYVAD